MQILACLEGPRQAEEREVTQYCANTSVRYDIVDECLNTIHVICTELHSDEYPVTMKDVEEIRLSTV